MTDFLTLFLLFTCIMSLLISSVILLSSPLPMCLIIFSALFKTFLICAVSPWKYLNKSSQDEAMKPGITFVAFDPYCRLGTHFLWIVHKDTSFFIILNCKFGLSICTVELVWFKE